MYRILLSLLSILVLISASLAQLEPAPPGVKLHGRSFADFESQQRSLLSNYCRLDFEGARLDPAGWNRFKPYTLLRANPEFTRIVIVTRFDIETAQQPSDMLIATYRTIGFYQQGEGFTAARQADQVEFSMQEHNGDLLVTSFTPDEPHVSPRAAVTWMNLLLNDPQTTDLERIHLKDAVMQLNKFLSQARPSAP